MSCCCIHGDGEEPSVSIKCMVFLVNLRNECPLKKESTAWRTYIRMGTACRLTNSQFAKAVRSS